MQIKYIAEDGVAFNTAEECRIYEAGNLMKMWDVGGRRAIKAGSAKYVYLPTQEATKLFIGFCDRENESHDGLTFKDTGLFVWAVEAESYVRLDPHSLREVIAEVED